MFWPRRTLLVLLLALAACPSQRDAPAARRADASTASAKQSKPWPALPWAEDRAAALIRARVQRKDSKPLAPVKAPALLELIKASARKGKLAAGWAAITQWLQRRLEGKRHAYLLWGTYHDSGAQVAAFRRLLGPQGLRGLTAATAEQYAADGRWRGVKPAEQRGDSADLARYLAGGKPADLAPLRRGQLDHDYTAWKYRYLHEVLDLAVTAWAGGVKLLGCDMPKILQRRLYKASKAPEHLPALRELHCLLHLDDVQRDAPRRVAMLWGQSHTEPGGLPRFLQRDAYVVAVRIVGQRPGPHGLAFELGRAGLRTVDPLLVPLSETPGMIRAALVLPDCATSARLYRTRDPEAKGKGAEARTSAAGTLFVDSRAHALEADALVPLPLSAGAHAFVFVGQDLLLTGSLDVPARGGVTLELLPDAKPAPGVSLTWKGLPQGSAAAGDPQ